MVLKSPVTSLILIGFLLGNLLSISDNKADERRDIEEYADGLVDFSSLQISESGESNNPRLNKIIVNFVNFFIFITLELFKMLFIFGYNLNNLPLFLIATLFLIIAFIKDILMLVLGTKYLFSEIRLNYRHYRGKA